MLRNRDRLEPRQGLRNNPGPSKGRQAREFFAFSDAKRPESFEKSRAARAKDSHIDYEIGERALPTGK